MKDISVVDIVTIIIALAAVFATVVMGFQQRKHNRLSVKPHLTFWTHIDDSVANLPNSISVEILNNGLGPAIIEGFELFVDQKRVEGKNVEKIHNAVELVFPKSEGYIYHLDASFLGEQYAMSSKESKSVVRIVFDEDSKLLPDMSEFFGRTQVQIIYKSAYEERFLLDSKELQASNPANASNSTKSSEIGENLFKNLIPIELFETQFKYIGYILLASVLASSAYLIGEYSNKLWEGCPFCVKLVAVGLALYAVSIAVAAVFLLVQEFIKDKVYFGYFILRRLIFLVLVGLISLVSVYIVMSAFFAAKDVAKCSPSPKFPTVELLESD